MKFPLLRMGRARGVEEEREEGLVWMWLECERGNEEIAAVPVPGSSLHE